jgi:hypothetical protein
MKSARDVGRSILYIVAGAILGILLVLSGGWVRDWFLS